MIIGVKEVATYRSIGESDLEDSGTGSEPGLKIHRDVSNYHEAEINCMVKRRPLSMPKKQTCR
jgi:hypothetical protein